MVYTRDEIDIRLQCVSTTPQPSTLRSSEKATSLIIKGWRAITVQYLSDRDLRATNAWLKSNCEPGSYWRTSRSYHHFAAEFWFKNYRGDAPAAMAMFADRALLEPYVINLLTTDQMLEAGKAVGQRTYTAFGRVTPDGYRYDLRFADAKKAAIVKLLLK